MPVLGSVADDALVRRTLAEHAVEVVFHAAAHKHVPLVEANALEGVRNNVLGTATLARGRARRRGRELRPDLDRQGGAADQRHGRDQALGRADRPQRPPRQRCAAPASASAPCASATCSAPTARCVPLFQEQIAAGGPVTLTDERHDALLHVDPRGGGADRAGRRAVARAATSSCSRWASRSASATSPRT